MNVLKRFWLLIAVIIAVACAGDALPSASLEPVFTDPPATQNPVPTPTQVAVVPTPAQTQSPTPVAPPTATPAQTPNATPTPTPPQTATPTPTAQPSASPSPTPTATTTPNPSPSPSASPPVPDQMTLLARWTTKFVPGPSNGDGANIRVPAERIDGTIVKPGEQFEFIDAISPVTSPPYAMGGYLKNGQIMLDPGILGGGMCSASTTLFNAAMRAGLRVVERHAHAIYIGRYPVGLDATVFSTGRNDGQNVKFVNDTGHPILIKAYGKRRKVTFEIWGVNDGRTVNLSAPQIDALREAPDFMEYSDDLAPGETQRTQDGYDGFNSTVVRTVKDAHGNVIWRDTFNSKYRMLSGIIKVGRYRGDPPAGTRIPADQYPGPPTDPPPSDPPPSDPPPSDPPPSDPPPSDPPPSG